MSEAQVTSGPRKIVIDPVTRVEGHGKVTIRLDAQGEVEQARFHIVEFRGFERFIQGRMYWEVPVIVQRLCGICPVSHHLCAAKAMDVVAGVDKITPTAEKMRRLMHYGQVLQSNAVNFFHLASPDLLLGFESPVESRNIFGVIEAFPEVGKWAIFIRKFGQQVIAATGGRRIHPRLCIPGGVNQNLTIEHRDALRQDIDQIIGWCCQALEMHKGFVHADPHRQQTFASFPSNYMSLTAPDGAMDLYDGDLRAIDASGKPILEGVHPADYRDHIVEEVRSWSYMKFPHIRSLGREDGWYRVGPLAQLNCCAYIGTPLAEAARKDFMLQGGGGPVHATLAYHWARMISMIHCAEVIREPAVRRRPAGDRPAGRRRAPPRRRGDHRGAARHPAPSLPGGRQRPGDPGQPDRLHHQQQRGDEPLGDQGRHRRPERPRDHRGPAEPHRGGDPRLRPLPVLRHPCARRHAPDRHPGGRRG